MIVLQINPVVKNGSTGRIVDQLGDIILEENWNSYIAYSGRPRNISKSSLIIIGNTFFSILHAIESRIFDNHGLSSRFSTYFFIKKLKKIKPDIIHFHNIHGYYLNYPQLVQFIRKRKIPVVWTFHDFWPITGHCTYFSDINCTKWIDGCFDCPKIQYYPKSILADNSKKNFLLKQFFFKSIENLTIITVSKWAESLVKQSFLKEKNIRTIYNGIDLTIFFPRGNRDQLRDKYHFEKDESIFIAAATTWSERKGFSDYIKLSELLMPKQRILLVGVSKKQAATLPKNITGIPRTENVIQLAELYSLSNIVLNLSYQETFGLTSVEGMACGIPGVVYNCTASPELINEEVGEIVSPGNLGGVIDAINKILNRGNDYYTINCIQRTQHHFSHRDRYDEYISLYNEILAR